MTTPSRRAPGSFVFWYLGASSLALVALVAVVVFLVFRLDRVTSNLQQVTAAQQASNIQQCQPANVTRGQDIAIWNRLLQVPPTVSAAAKAEVAQLEHLVQVKDTPRDCTAAYPPG